MGIIGRISQYVDDGVKQAQGFVMCRQAGILLAAIVMARVLPVSSVGVIEMLMLCGFLLTFFWSDALLKGFLSSGDSAGEGQASAAFIWIHLFTGLGWMAVLVLAQKFLIPLLVDRSELEGLDMFAMYQALIITVWVAPFTGMIRKWNQVFLSLYVLIGPALGCGIGLMFLPSVSGVLLGLLTYALLGFGWIMSHVVFVSRAEIKKVFLMLWPLSWPLILYAVSAGIARSFDAWLVARYFDDSTFAIFRYGAREFPLAVAFAAGLSTMMIPKLVHIAALPELKKRSTRLMHICYPIVALLMLASPWLFKIFFGQAYVESAFIFNVYMLLTLTQLVFPQSVMMARGDSRKLWHVSMIELAINIICSLILLSYFGLIGIVWGTVIAFAAEKIILLSMVRKHYGITVYNLTDTRTWGLYGSLLITTCLLSGWIHGI